LSQRAFRVSGSASCDIVDESLVQRPGIHLAFPVIDDGIAETESLGLLIGNPRRFPRGSGGAQVFFSRFRHEGIHRLLQLMGGDKRVFVLGLGQVRIVLQHGLFAGSGPRLGGQ